MHLTHTIADIRTLTRAAHAEGRPVALVPTMGALHDGHLSLVRAARELPGDPLVVVSIFVNPLQFAPGEDLDAYPRTLDRDVAKLGDLADAVFAPSPAEMYPLGPRTTITPGPSAARFEGATRPTHFAGVLTVVNKLFQITGADHAFFGEKDFQQLAIVRQMVADFNIPVEVHGAPLVRDTDGVALSSRNAYLSDAERVEARSISRALLDAARESRADDVLRVAGEELSGMDVDYLALVTEDLGDVAAGHRGPARLIAAVRVGQVRLLDNVPVVLG